MLEQHERVWVQVGVFSSGCRWGCLALSEGVWLGMQVFGSGSFLSVFSQPSVHIWGLEGTGNLPTLCSGPALEWRPTHTPRASNTSWVFGSSVLGEEVIQGIKPK